MKTKVLLLTSVVLLLTGTGFALTTDPNVFNGTFEDPVLSTASIDGINDWWQGQAGSGVNTRKWGSGENKGGSQEGFNFAQLVANTDSIIQPVALFQPNTPYTVSCLIEKRRDQLGPAGRIELWAGGTALPTNDPLLSGNQYGSANWPLTLTGATLVDSISFDFSWKGKWSYLWLGQQTFTLATGSSHTTSDTLYLVFVKTGGGQMALDAVTMTISGDTVLTSPENGAVDVPVEATLEWVGPGTYDNEIFDVYVGTTEPNFSEGAPYGLTTDSDLATAANSSSPALDYETTYYWVVDVYEPNAAEPGGYLYHPATTFSSFTTIQEDVAPVVDITQNGGRTWNGAPAVVLDALVTDLEAIASVAWEVTEYPAAYTGDPALFLTNTTSNLNAPTAVFAVNTVDPNALGAYTITLTATDDAAGAGALVGTDTVWFTVGETACDAHKANNGWILPEDINSDCKVDLLDLAELAQGWLDDRNPGSPIIYLP